MSRRTCVLLAASLLLASAGCGLTSGSPMVDDVEPGSIGKGLPLGAPISRSPPRSSPSS